MLSPCNGGKLLSYYCFFAREHGDYTNQAWGTEDLPTEQLLAPYPTLDRQVFEHLKIGKEIQPWRLWVHDPYPYLQKENVCLLGDAGHPMMPHQSQGACMAIEDAGALGVLFDQKHFNGDIRRALKVYEEVRLPRVTRVQAAAAKAAYNINERIGKRFRLVLYSGFVNEYCLRFLGEQERFDIQSRGPQEGSHHRRDELVSCRPQ